MFELTRRAALSGMAASAAGCASSALAQTGAYGVRMPTMPCANQPDDIVALLLDGNDAPSSTVVVFGQAFAPGDLPRGASLVARSADGRALPLQADIKTSHPDGSVRFAVVSLAAPALRRNERAGVILRRAVASGSGEALDIATALAGRQAVVEITPPDGGAPWRADLLVQFRASLQRGDSLVWQSGPLAVQARVMAAVPAEAVGGMARLRLVADVAVRADGMLWVAVWIRNDHAMQATGGPALYALKLLLDGREALRFPQLRQAQYQALGRTRMSLRRTLLSAVPHVRHDAAYLANFGAVPHYDLAAGIDEALLSRAAQAVAAPEWSLPFASRGLTPYMPTTGGRPEIGPATLWQAAWLISGDPRAMQYALGQAEAIGTVPWHYWDETHRTWINTDHYPKLWTEIREPGRPGDRNAQGLTQPFPAPAEIGGWRQDDAHQPDVSSVPYMLTGERWLLDNLQAQTATAVMQTYPAHRLDDIPLVVNGPQQRSVAWALRQIDNAAWLSPDGSAEQAYFQKVSRHNWGWLAEKISDWTRRQGAAFGWLPGTIGAQGVLAPWQQDYFVTTVVAAATRGNPDARRFLEWQSNFLIGRFTHEAQGFPPAFGASFLLAVAEPTTHYVIDGTIFQTWAEMATAQQARNLGGPRPWPNATLNQLALASLAGVYNVLGSDDAITVFRRLQGMRILGSSLAEFQVEPTWSIVPHGFTRAAARLPACQPARSGAGPSR